MKLFLALAFFFLGLFSLSESFGQGDRSQDLGGSIVKLAVKNNTQQNIVVAWVNFQGRMESYGSLTPGRNYVLDTYPGHLWKFGVGSQVLGEYRATTAAKQTYVIQPAPAVTSTKTNPGGSATGTKPPVASSPGVKAGVAPAAAPAIAPGATGSKLTPAEAQQVIAFHNKARTEVGVGGVAWSAEIAAFAQQWADHLARSGQFAHRPRDQQRYGENLAAAQSIVAGMNMWYAEKKLFPAGAAFSMRLMPAGHYTQMVWRGSTQIGAGKAVIASGPYAGLTVLVCNYSPQGNVVGQKPY
ncbi:MAG: CAP domain-containing protein [Verrucomicrobiales bacterium]|nr:CAP domain-containing protein [Verrucomicrobiales bacterium]